MQSKLVDDIQTEMKRTSESLPSDYAERVYAGVLGKIIGVYLGRPVENWLYQRIIDELGEIDYYVHEKRGRHLVITDDDISGTFTFLRALEDYGCDPNLTPQQIGQTWLNYLIEKTTILWWGGLGNSTEHTAYLRLKSGIPAPRSGSRELNSKVVSEQIGSQIFIDGWGMVSPGDPERAADFARRAASVSHDGEAIYGAQVVASMVAHAFVERDINKLLDTALSHIPEDSVIAGLINDLREWHASGSDWRRDRERLEQHYGYDKYLGNVHIVPNHGLIILSLLHGNGEFERSMTIVNTCGWDTDCNSGNVGCILGVRNGLACFENGPDWRGPVADRLFLPSADPGRSITDAVRESDHIVNMGRALAGLEPIAPKNGARFHFSFPGSVQGFRAETGSDEQATLQLSNDHGRLALQFKHVGAGRSVRATTHMFIPRELLDYKTGYVLVASPTLHPGHTVRAALQADSHNTQTVYVSLFLRHYDDSDELTPLRGPQSEIPPGTKTVLEWTVPELGGQPIGELGMEISSESQADGALYVETIDWTGAPTTTFPLTKGTLWGKAWAKALDRFEYVRDGYEHLVHNEGTGLLIQGGRDWKDYHFSATIIPKMMAGAGIGVRVQGLRRYYALMIGADHVLRLIKELDGTQVIAEAPFDWTPYTGYRLELGAIGPVLRASIDGRLAFEVSDESPLDGGGIALVCSEGWMGARDLAIRQSG